MTENLWRLLFRGLAVAFAVTGLTFYLFPIQVIEVMNSAGSVFGLPDAPPMGHRFWLSLGSAYMAVVTALAWLIAADPAAGRPMMLALAVGKTTSSLTCLGYVLSDAPYFIYWANFAVDASLALVAIWAWLATAKLPGGRAGAGGSGGGRPVAPETLGPTLSAMVGSADPALVARLSGQVSTYFAELGPHGSLGLRLLHGWLNLLPLLLGPRRRTLSRLTAAEREAALERIEAARSPLARAPLHMFKLIVMMHHYEQPDVQRTIGYRPEYLDDKLAARGHGVASPAHVAH
jgi:hypothetical protein